MRIDLQIAAHLSQQVATDFFLPIFQRGEFFTEIQPPMAALTFVGHKFAVCLLLPRQPLQSPFEFRTLHRSSIGQMCPIRQVKEPGNPGSLFVYSGGVVINQYIAVALRRAHYELLENGEGFYGSIPELAGVWAQSSTLEVCRDELKLALEDWLLFSLSRQASIPVLDGIDLVVREVA